MEARPGQSPFGEALRRARVAAGLTQEQLAERAHLSWRGISDIERGARRSPRRDTVSLLAGALALTGDARAEFEALARPALSLGRTGAEPAYRGGDGSGIPAPAYVRQETQSDDSPPGLAAPQGADVENVRGPEQPAGVVDDSLGAHIEPQPNPGAERAGNLPRRLTSFLGRREVLAAVSALVQSSGLVTITGPGGCGKTRLALELADSLQGQFADGPWLVDLAPIESADRVPMAVAAALGLQQEGEPGGHTTFGGRPPVTFGPPGTTTAKLQRWLAGRSILLVLDNCEHLVEACADLANQLLQASPGLTILATSRESLAIAGEHVWPLEPLPIPQEGVLDVAAVARSDAALLFVERARARRPQFALDPETAPFIAEIVRRLDGLPLAIELAAALVEELPLDTIAGRLDASLSLLTRGARASSPRHQALRAALEWSYEQLTAAERTLFRRLAVFCGSWSLEACEQMFDDARLGEPVAALVGMLVRKSLVQRAQLGSRYRLLETMRQFAWEQLTASHEVDAARDAHLAWCLRLAPEAEPRLKGPEQRQWLDKLDEEYEHLAGAMAWALSSSLRLEQAAMLATALARFWQARSRMNDGWYWLERCLQAVGAKRPSPVLYGRLLCSAGMIAWNQWNLIRARALLSESFAIAEQAGDKQEAGYAAFWLSFVHWFRGEVADCEAQLRVALALFEDVGDRWGTAMARKQLVQTSLGITDIGRAEAPLAESEAELQSLGDVAESTWARLVRAGFAIGRGDRAGGAALLRTCIPAARELGLDRLAAMAQHQLAWLAMLDGDPAGALWQLEAVRVTAVRAGDPMMELSAQRGIAMAHALLGNAEECSRRLEAAVDVSRRLEDPRFVVSTLADLAYAQIRRGEIEGARVAIGESVSLARQGGGTAGQAKALMVLGHFAAATGRHRRALACYRRALNAVARSGRNNEHVPRRTLLLTILGVSISLAACGDMSHLNALLGAAQNLRRMKQVILLPCDEAALRSLALDAERSGGEATAAGLPADESVRVALAAVNGLHPRQLTA